jgi:hypothetical protein
MASTPPFREFDSAGAASQVLRNFRMGAICPADLWRQLEELLAGREVEQILEALPPESQAALREVYRERPISFRVFGRGSLRRRIRRWVRAPPTDCGGAPAHVPVNRSNPRR